MISWIGNRDRTARNLQLLNGNTQTIKGELDRRSNGFLCWVSIGGKINLSIKACLIPYRNIQTGKISCKLSDTVPVVFEIWLSKKRKKYSSENFLECKVQSITKRKDKRKKMLYRESNQLSSSNFAISSHADSFSLTRVNDTVLMDKRT